MQVATIQRSKGVVIRKPNLLLLVICVSGLLMNTSVINTPKFGVPFFYAAIIIVLLGYGLNLSRARILSVEKKVFDFTFWLAFSYVIIIFLQILFLEISAVDEVKQLISRVSFIVFFFLSYTVIIKNNPERVLAYCKLLLKILFVYGIYQFFAFKAGLPFFLEFLRNSASFNTAPSVVGGWLGTVRSYSIWSEPSFSALPLGFFLYLLIFYRENKKEFILWWLIATVYAFLTFSRLVWLIEVLAIGLVVFHFLMTKRRKYIATLKRLKYFVVPFFILVASSWVYIVPNVMNDLSANSRASSVIIGFKVFIDHIFVGSGMNTYASLQGLYKEGIEFFHRTQIVHNVFVSYAQQMGVIGLLICLLPLFFLLSLKNIDIRKRIYMALVLATIGTFGGDFYYMPLVWLILAILSAQNFKKEFESRKIERYI